MLRLSTCRNIYGRLGSACAALGSQNVPSRLFQQSRHFSQASGQEISPGRLRVAKILSLSMPLAGLGVLAYGFLFPDPDPLLHFPQQQKAEQQSTPAASQEQHIINWSGTHEVNPKQFWQPETEEEVEAIVAAAHREGRRVRVVGSGLSPNGIGFSAEGMLSMALLDRVLRVDADKKQVTVQAGCRVQQVADALKPHGLTLQNYASIREQQIGGFTQVGAHGTGARIPPVDEQVVGLKLVTPSRGVVHVTRESDPELFNMARVGLGGLGVVTEVVLQCVPAHQLREETLVASAKEVRRNHARWMQEYQHLRYMWIPHTPDVVVVRSNPLPPDAQPPSEQPAPFSDAQRLAPLRELLQKRTGQAAADVEELSATQLRDALLALAPLELEWVKQVNAAEAKYWRMSTGTRVGYSDAILGFDCGGQQWVLEVALPVGPLDKMSGWWAKHRDLDYMADLMKEIEAQRIPAPAPIEQRWTAASTSSMSPANGGAERGEVHSWVGVIMYLPEEDLEQRQQVTEAFQQYARMVEQKLMPRYSALWHWAKLEPHRPPQQLAAIRQQLASRLPVQRYIEYRRQLDPNNVLGNDFLDAVFPLQD